ncbi:MAG: GldG family protein [Mariprofundales bacterium]
MTTPIIEKMDKRNYFKNRARLVVLLCFIGAAVIFFAANVSHLRLDMTDNQLFTLSSSTQQVLAKLEEPIMIRAYVTPNLPHPYGRLHRFVEDMLHLYHQAGHGQVGYEVIDPSDNPNVMSSLQAMGIPKIQVQAIEDDRAEVKQGYLAIVVEYLDKREVIPVVQSETGFEYDLTRKIKKVTGKGRGIIAVIAAAGAKPLSSLQALAQNSSDDYELLSINPNVEAIPLNARAILIPVFTEEPSEKTRYAIDQFRLRGGGVLVLAGNAIPNLQAGFAMQTVDAKANAWLANYGIVFDPGLVMDELASRIMVNQQNGYVVFRTAIDYPFLPQVTDIHASHPVTAGLQSISVPFAAPIQLGDTKGANATVLLRSSAKAAVQAGPPFDINPMTKMQKRFAGISRKPSVLAVAISGKAVSAFPSAIVDAYSANEYIGSSEQSRLLVVASPSMFDDDFMQSEAGNVFALNSLDWLAGDEALIALRSRGVNQRPLTSISSAARTVWKGLWMFGLPLLVALIGIIRWRMLRLREDI